MAGPAPPLAARAAHKTPESKPSRCGSRLMPRVVAGSKRGELVGYVSPEGLAAAGKTRGACLRYYPLRFRYPLSILSLSQVAKPHLPSLPSAGKGQRRRWRRGISPASASAAAATGPKYWTSIGQPTTTPSLCWRPRTGRRRGTTPPQARRRTWRTRSSSSRRAEAELLRSRTSRLVRSSSRARTRRAEAELLRSRTSRLIVRSSSRPRARRAEAELLRSRAPPCLLRSSGRRPPRPARPGPTPLPLPTRGRRWRPPTGSCSSSIRSVGPWATPPPVMVRQPFLVFFFLAGW